MVNVRTGITQRHAAPAVPVLGWTLLVALVAFVCGAAWDIQWHYAIGRDRPFIPPHLLLLAGIILSGLASVAAVLWRSTRFPRADLPPYPLPKGKGSVATHAASLGGAGDVTLLRVFHAPLGAYLAGFGALSAALAFPLDDYWHHLYGLDVTIWAPFHVMIVGGMTLVALGAAYLFAAHKGDRGAAAARAGMVLSLTMGAAVALLLQAQALDKEGILAAAPLTGRAGVVFPTLLAALTVPWLVAAAVAVPVPGGATAVAVGITALRWALLEFVPVALRWSAALEGAHIRESNMRVIATPMGFPAWSLVADLAIDIVWWLVCRRRASTVSGAADARGAAMAALARALPALAAAGAVAGLVLAMLDRVWQRTLPAVPGGAGLDLRQALVDALPLAVVAGLVAAVYGAALGGALGTLTFRQPSRATLSAVYGLALALGAAALWSLVLAAQGVIGPPHPPLLPLPAGWSAGPVPAWFGWVVGLLPAWGLLALVVAEAAGLRLRGAAHKETRAMGSAALRRAAPASP